MKLFTVVFLGVVLSMLSQQPAAHREIGIAREPHHQLILEKAEVRVFHLSLGPGQATLLHQHSGPYAFLSLQNVTISNEVPTHQPVLAKLIAGDIHISKGGFRLVERNTSQTAAHLIVIERKGMPRAPFGVPMADFSRGESGVTELFESGSMRAYLTWVAAGSQTATYEEKFDRLIVATMDLHLQDQLDGQTQAVIEMKPGDVRWIPKGTDHSITNLGQEPCSFITIEFN